MWHDFLEMIGMILALMFAMFVSIFMVAALWQVTISKSECDSYQDVTGLETTHDFYNGCFVTMEDGRIVQKKIYEDIITNDYKIILDK